jgi:hypothetical protein
MTEYKLHNTDGETFFEFRSNPNSRTEAFTVSYLDDGTSVMSGDYGTLCWRRGQEKDYGFPSNETNISYFAEKISQWGIQQKIEEFSKEHFIESLAESYSERKKWEEFLEEVNGIDDKDEFATMNLATKYFDDAWECSSIEYTPHFVEVFQKLKSVSQQILDKVNERYKYVIVCTDQLAREGSLLFWKPNSMGYTSDIDKAGIYEEKNAKVIESHGDAVAIRKNKILDNYEPRKIIITSIYDIQQFREEQK